MSFRIIGVGEVLWDLLPAGKKLGGAPANFAYHAQALGAEAMIISRVGDDEAGREILERLRALGLSTQHVSTDPTYPTGTVTVQLQEGGEPRYTIGQGVAWDHLTADPAMLECAATADAICFGSLGQRSASSLGTIRTILGAAKRGALRIFDVNLRQDFYSRELIHGSLDLANVLKLNESELPVLAELLRLRGDTSKEQLAELAERFSLRLVIYTCGARGSLLYDGRDWSEQSAGLVEVKDTVGAGDSLTAAVTLGLLAGWDLTKIGAHASAVAAYVCAQEGATPPMPAAFVITPIRTVPSPLL